jgi:membrane associated rhomboid family serine protease
VNVNQNGLMATPLSTGLIAACAIIFFMQNISPDLALWPLESGYFQIWQPVSYSFLHGNFNHLFFNMLAVWMFGFPLEKAWGSQRYSMFYLACVVGAAVMQIVVQQFEGGLYPTIGASGGVFGLLLAYGVMWPNNRMFLIFLPVPIKAKWFVLIYGAVELLFGVTNTMPGVAHFAHLGGMLFGAGLLYKWGWRPGMTWRR